MSHIGHYQVLHNRTVNFGGKYRWSNRLVSVSQASMITLKLLQWFKCKKQHKSLALTTYHYLIIRIIFQWFSSTLMLILSAIHHFVRITLFIAYMPLAGSSTEQVIRYSYREWWSWQQPRSCGITQNIGVVFVSKRSIIGYLLVWLLKCMWGFPHWGRVVCKCSSFYFCLDHSWSYSVV